MFCTISRNVRKPPTPEPLFQRVFCNFLVICQAAGVETAALKALGVGTSAGALGSLVGMGGGFVAIPSLTGWLRLTQVRHSISRRLDGTRAYGEGGTYFFPPEAGSSLGKLHTGCYSSAMSKS